MTSDKFFKKFNVIFIDGLHNYKQYQKDCLNSIRSLEDEGIIIVHDFLQNLILKKMFKDNKMFE